MYKFTLAIFISFCLCFSLSADVEKNSPALVQCPDGTVAISPADTSLCQNKTGGSSSCVICNYCGNDITITEHGEECDDADDDQEGGDVDECRACLEPYCGDGIFNEYDPVGNTCDTHIEGCRDDCTMCSDNVKDEIHGEECDGTDTAAGEYCRADCLFYGCGNGFLEPDSPHGAETCELDDPTCREPSCTKCGDNVHQAAFEECDGTDLAGETDVDATCNAQCEFNPFCGDDEENQSFEECDDGNQSNTDTCTNDCKDPRCGDGHTQASNNERCDDGNSSNTDACLNTCQPGSCGDGYKQPVLGEQCDKGGNNGNGAAYWHEGRTRYYCNSSCGKTRIPYCGDGNYDAGEQCDHGANNGNGNYVLGWGNSSWYKYYACTSGCGIWDRYDYCGRKPGASYFGYTNCCLGVRKPDVYLDGGSHRVCVKGYNPAGAVNLALAYGPVNNNYHVVGYSPNGTACWTCSTARSGRGCFDPESKILMADGSYKMIQDISAGELVLNPELGKGVAVKSVIESPELEQLIELTVDGQTLKVTRGHPMLTSNGVVRADALGVNDLVQVASGEFKRVDVLSNLEISASQRVFNITLESETNDYEEHMIVADGIVTGDLVAQKTLADTSTALKE